MTYKVDLPIFEGPLDLLLHLIKKDEINIYDIPISKITKQYMEYIGMMEMLDINIAGEFLVMAATLMHIKSKMLLPAPDTDEDTIDPREELVLQLLEYKRFKEVAGRLQKMEEVQSHFYKRNFLDEVENPDEDGFIHDVDIFDLMSAFQGILENLPKETDYTIEKDTMTVTDMILEIMGLLKHYETLLFASLFKKCPSKLVAVTVFLAMLELIKMRRVSVRQDKTFADVAIFRGEKYERRDKDEPSE